jgi:hypothetical protein
LPHPRLRAALCGIGTEAMVVAIRRSAAASGDGLTTAELGELARKCLELSRDLRLNIY